ncbi:MAG: hypothetical protein R2695_13810 [Acidimicrobiales bacterium]
MPARCRRCTVQDRVARDSTARRGSESMRSGEGATAPQASRSPALLGSVIALSVSFTLGAVFVLAPLVWQITPITELPRPCRRTIRTPRRSSSS